MMKNHKKKCAIILSITLLLALVVFFVVIPIKKKTIAPTLDTASKSLDTEGTVDVTAPEDESDATPITPTTTSENPSVSTGVTAPAETPANPDSSTSITTPQTTDYSNVTGSQFDARN